MLLINASWKAFLVVTATSMLLEKGAKLGCKKYSCKNNRKRIRTTKNVEIMEQNIESLHFGLMIYWNF